MYLLNIKSGFIWLQPSVEAVWAMKAVEHAEVYFNVSIEIMYEC
jgi:hypothetical protein